MAGGLARLIARLPGQRPPRESSPIVGAILCFGAVRESVRERFVASERGEISKGRLEQLIARLRREADITTLSTLLERAGAGVACRPAIVLWFEGQGRSISDVARPLLTKLDAPYTVTISASVPDERTVVWPLLLDHLIWTREAVSIDVAGEKRVLSLHSSPAKHETLSIIMSEMDRMSAPQRSHFVADMAVRAGIDPKTFFRDRLLSWSDIETLARDPLATLGAGALDLEPLSTLDEASMQRQIRDGVKTLAAVLGREVTSFAYPAGSAGPREFAFAASLGLHSAATDRPGVVFAAHTNHRTALPRISIDETNADAKAVLNALRGRGPQQVPGYTRLDVE
jgi:peptidoglycan/xylan/chitin deacetylase (PgdA/CDA1 family)